VFYIEKRFLNKLNRNVWSFIRVLAFFVFYWKPPCFRYV